MKPDQIRELVDDEIRRRLEETEQEILNLRFQQAGGEVQQPTRIRFLRRDRARFLTVLRERRNASGKSEPAGSATDQASPPAKAAEPAPKPRRRLGARLRRKS